MEEAKIKIGIVLKNNTCGFFVCDKSRLDEAIEVLKYKIKDIKELDKAFTYTDEAILSSLSDLSTFANYKDITKKFMK